MGHQVTIHEAQTSILRELLFHPEAGFAELQKPTGLESDHFKFHMKRLVELGYVEKNEKSGKYSLSHKGKEHANKLDTDTHTVERQPKLSVLIMGHRKTKDGKTEFLVQQRLKNPYFGYWGRIGGKITWGETAIEAAARELKEETGLEADFEFMQLYHKQDYNEETTEMLEDKFFLMFSATNMRGHLIEEFEGGKNTWLTQSELMKQTKVFADMENSQKYLDEPMMPLRELKYSYKPEDY